MNQRHPSRICARHGRVTARRWDRLLSEELMGVNPSHFSAIGPGKDAVKDLDTSEFPVEMVSWFDAIDFCNKLSEKEQRVPYYVRDGEVVKIQGGTGYRLPTEAEWESACRAGTTTRWSFVDSERDLRQHAVQLQLERPDTAGGGIARQPLRPA